MAIRTVNTGGFDLLYGFFLHALIPVSFSSSVFYFTFTLYHGL